MHNKIVDILSSYDKPKNICAMGNEAIARGALEVGVNGIFSYPGTPSTEISEIFNHISNFQRNADNQRQYPQLTENPIYFEYSINEKIALEKAIAYSIGNRSAMCVMKNVGMNVASDALMSITYQTIIAPLVIVLCDDPGCHSSSNEQDSRYWGSMASVPVFNPATPQESYKMVQDAFELSGQIKLPVILRTTTRVSHTRGMLEYKTICKDKRIAHFDRLPEHINIPARTATAHQKLIGKLHSQAITKFHKRNIKVYVPDFIRGAGIISSGVAAVYLREILHRNHLDKKVAVFEVGMIYPFPEEEIIGFLERGFKKVLILEELEPIVENSVRSIIQKRELKCKVYGKNYSSLSAAGEYSLEIVEKVVESFTGAVFKVNSPLEGYENYIKDLAPRPPALCAGCPHRATYYALKLAVPRDTSEVILCGDIGCSGLGALPPLRMIDTINHMGMSVSMAQGLSEAFRSSSENHKIVAMIGDGTFFHSGVASLLNAVYTRSNLLLIIFDNRTIGMTGHQDHPGATHLTKYHEIDIIPLLKGMGIPFVETINPFDIRDTFAKINKAMTVEGVSVVVSKAPCIFIPEFKESIPNNAKVIIDHTRCNTCHNHEDVEIACSRCYSSKSNLSRARAKMIAEVHVPAETQLCPANICNHGFFNSILEKDYKSAIEIVRDKMLFSRTCGDICHRPCELLAASNDRSIVPIKKLKKFVSSFDENFRDFSNTLKRVESAVKKNKRIAIVGAGPAGLSAAYDLIRNGYQVTVFDKENQGGGLVKYAIPGFRMDKTGFDFEVSKLFEMGVEYKFNTVLGKDITLEELTTEYDGVVLAVGLWKSKKLEIIDKNISPEKRFDSLTFLKAYNQEKLNVPEGSTILVIGGGNSAIDSARSAKKFNVKNKVYVSCVETVDKMPAFAEEVGHALEEGVQFINDSFVHQVGENKKGQIEIELKTYIDQKNIQNLLVDYVIVAIGLIGNTSDYAELEGSLLGENGRVKANVEDGHTRHKNVFVAGDIYAGNHMSVIGAIASGKKAVTGIRKLLEGYPYPYEGYRALEKLNNSPVVPLKSRQEILDNKIIEEAEHFDLFQACMKCNHCIDNFGCPAMVKVDGKVVIEYSKCTNCGLCIDVCPNNAIRWQEDDELIAEQVKI